MSFFGSSSTAATAGANDPKDVEVSDPPPDSISAISFSPVADFLAVGSWDNNVRVPQYLDIQVLYIEYNSKGTNIRSRTEWANPGESNVSTSSARAEHLLEQGMLGRILAAIRH